MLTLRRIVFKKESESQSQFQVIGNILGFFLPIAQIFLNYLPGKTKSIFLISDNFFFVSIAAALFSYVLILLIKNNIWFRIPMPPVFNKKLKKQQEYFWRTNPNVFSAEDIRDYQSNHSPQQPYYLDSNNITYLLLLPLMFICYLVFFGLGLFEQNNASLWDVFCQSISYVLLVAVTTLTLAIYYMKDLNNKQFQEKEMSKIDDVKSLLYANNSLEELPIVKFIGQTTTSIFPSNLVTAFKVNDGYYKVVTDINAQKLFSVDRYDTLEDMSHEG